MISLLVIISMGFFFTLGLHYGKKVALPEEHHAPIGKLEESPDLIPSRESLESAARHSGVATEESIKESTQAAVENSKIKMEAPKQVDLPKEKVKPTPAPTKPKVAQVRYGVQLGSYPSKAEAANRVKLYAVKGIETEIRSAQVAGQTRYRVIIGGFKSKSAAETRAKELRAKSKIGSFVIIKAEE